MYIPSLAKAITKRTERPGASSWIQSSVPQICVLTYHYKQT